VPLDITIAKRIRETFKRYSKGTYLLMNIEIYLPLAMLEDAMHNADEYGISISEFIMVCIEFAYEGTLEKHAVFPNMFAIDNCLSVPMLRTQQGEE
jgi:hypothetical protein